MAGCLIYKQNLFLFFHSRVIFSFFVLEALTDDEHQTNIGEKAVKPRNFFLKRFKNAVCLELKRLS